MALATSACCVRPAVRSLLRVLPLRALSVSRCPCASVCVCCASGRVGRGLATKAKAAKAPSGVAAAARAVLTAVGKESSALAAERGTSVADALADLPGVAHVPSDDGAVVLRLSVDGASVEARFEPSEVASALFSSENDAVENETETDAEAEDDFGDFSEPDAMPFGLSLDVARPGAPDRVLRLSLDVAPDAGDSHDAPDVISLADGSSYAAYLTDAVLLPRTGDAPLPGPALESVDADVRDALAAYARALLPHVLPAVAAVASAADGAAYRSFLADVRRVFS